MRFFRDRDEQEQPYAGRDEHPEAVRSSPVPVPTHPPADGDPVDVPLDDRGTFDDPVVPGTVAQPFYGTPAEDATTPIEVERRTAGPWAAGPRAGDATAAMPAGSDEEFAYHEPAPQPTAFGAATVSGAVAASAAAGMAAADGRTDTDRRTDADSGVADDRLGDDPRFAGTGTDDRGGDDPVVGHSADVPDAALDDHGTFGDPVAAGGRTDGSGSGDVPDEALDDHGTFDDPVVAGDTPVGDGGVAASGERVDGATGGPAPEGMLPGTVTAPTVGPLFAATQATGFRDRWRDVQLRFVDDPKGAADEARGLLDEVVDALTTSLREQKDQLGGRATAGDTEQLRVEVRSYRDFLDRLLAL